MLDDTPSSKASQSGHLWRRVLEQPVFWLKRLSWTNGCLGQFTEAGQWLVVPNLRLDDAELMCK